MQTVKIYTKEELLKLTRPRSGEEKIGEVIGSFSTNWQSDLAQNDCKFVLFGIAEDIGVRANYGRAGASTAFRPALESFLNQQSNHFFDPASVLVLGEIFVDDLMKDASELDLKNKQDVKKLRDLVSVVDERVTEVMKQIISAGKIPIVIGGGHNNAYGNIKGASLALDKKINVINCDPHLDFREPEGRHSGNGFSYAYEQGFLGKYAVCCMHEQYNNQPALNKFKNDPVHLFYNTYESVFVRSELGFSAALKQCLGFVGNEPCGVEIDLDAITNVPSSAKTSSGISPTQARQYVYQSAVNANTLYLHVAEGAPVLSHIKADNKTGKLIAYLVFDFMKGVFAKK
ncbi:MAG: formimidoylglutamase [Bacteroidota bacterium]